MFALHSTNRLLQTLAAMATAAAGIALAAAPAGASFPGANGRIVFSSDRPAAYGGTSFELYSMAGDGSDLRRLTYNSYLPPGTGDEESGEECNGGKGGKGGEGETAGGLTAFASAPTEAGATPIDDVQPAVSPDGRQIAFVSNRQAADHTAYQEIYVMSIDGAKVRQLTSASQVSSGPKAAYEPAWSPDGRQIVFRRGEGAKADLWVLDIATGHLTRLLTAYEKGPAGYDAQPSWSPDGSEIAFVKGFGRAADIWVYHLDGPHQGESMPVIHALNVAESSPSWSPDGSQIVYSRGDQAAGGAIWVARADGSDQRPLSVPSPDAEGKVYSDLAPRFSPDGRQIVFESTRDGMLAKPDTSTTEGECKDDEGEEAPSGAVEIFTMNADGSHLTRLTAAGGAQGPQDLSPDWQPIPLPAVPPPVVPTQPELKSPVVEVPVVSQAGRRCLAPNAKLTIILGKVDRRHMRSVHARVGGHRVAVHVHGRRIEVPLKRLRSLKGKVAVEVDVLLRYGNHLRGTHLFLGCTGKRSDGVATFRLQRR
jgi:Tol biopolymer transport system component